VILNPLVHSAAIQSGTNMGVMATGLVGSLQLTHALVPPTPGPLAAVALVGADIGTVILWGSLITLVGSVAGWLFAMVVGPKLASPPSDEFVGVDEAKTELPSLGWAYAPILIPLLLIAGQSFADFALPEDNVVNLVLQYLGWPVVALAIGVLLAYRSANPDHRKVWTSEWVENALRGSAMIIMVTGLGGALSSILQATPAVEAIASGTESIGLPAIFLPFVLGVVGNMITGSTTVGVITAASVTAPLLPVLGLGPEAAMLSGASGSVVIKYVNSSYFWVAASLSRMPLKSALIAYGGVTFVGGVVSMACVYALWAAGIL
jgi:gluconate:H+ symporter, GntP family